MAESIIKCRPIHRPRFADSSLGGPLFCGNKTVVNWEMDALEKTMSTRLTCWTSYCETASCKGSSLHALPPCFVQSWGHLLATSVLRNVRALWPCPVSLHSYLCLCCCCFSAMNHFMFQIFYEQGGLVIPSRKSWGMINCSTFASRPDYWPS